MRPSTCAVLMPLVFLSYTWCSAVTAEPLSNEEFHTRERIRQASLRDDWSWAYFLAYRFAQNRSGELDAEEHALRLIHDSSEPRMADVAALRLASYYFTRERFGDAKLTLVDLIESRPKGVLVINAKFNLAQVHEKLGEESAMVARLKELADLEPIPTNRGIMDTSDTRQTALHRLGKYYLSKGDRKEAYFYLSRWAPRSWCGTCRLSMEAERKRLLAQCRDEEEPLAIPPPSRITQAIAILVDGGLVTLALFYIGYVLRSSHSGVVTFESLASAPCWVTRPTISDWPLSPIVRARSRIPTWALRWRFDRSSCWPFGPLAVSPRHKARNMKGN